MNVPSSTIWITGSSGFIGKALIGQGHPGCTHDGLLRGNALPEHIQTIVHAGRDPRIGTLEYRLEDDIEYEIAKVARERRLKFIMLSSRKVYGSQPSPIHEEAACEPIDDYGAQKLAMEQRLTGLLGEELTILRLSNVFGYESGRKTFMGMMLDGLLSRGEIQFNMSPQTARDFIPIDSTARAILAIAANPPGGVFNIGSGLPILTGDLAEAVIRGFGAGILKTTDDRIRDAFNLDTSRMLTQTGVQVTKHQVLEAATKAGAQLRHSMQNKFMDDIARP